METKLIGPGEVARMLRASPKTVARWSVEGKIPVAFTTLGGHRKYDAAVIERIADSLVGKP